LSISNNQQSALDVAPGLTLSLSKDQPSKISNSARIGPLLTVTLRYRLSKWWRLPDTRMALTTFSAAHASEDARLVRAARAGDERAFGALYERYARVIHGVLLARAPKTDVEDLVQDVFLSAWNRLESLRDPAAFGGWLTMIARNRATDFHRQSVDSVELPDDLTAPEASSARAEALGVLEIIRTLPAAYRETLVLRLVEGLTGPEIAERTGLTPASVRVNLHRGMTMLREKLER
jgi:RNA polymerase sigma-70 factor (ECF subfamily)